MNTPVPVQPKLTMPFPRSVLGAAFNTTVPQRRRDALHVVLVVALAAEIHRDPVKVQGAALEMYLASGLQALLMIVQSQDPLRLVEILVQEME